MGATRSNGESHRPRWMIPPDQSTLVVCMLFPHALVCTYDATPSHLPPLCHAACLYPTLCGCLCLYECLLHLTHITCHHTYASLSTQRLSCTRTHILCHVHAPPSLTAVSLLHTHIAPSTCLHASIITLKKIIFCLYFALIKIA